MPKPFYIACDFDGTIVDHRFPDIGQEAAGACGWLRRWREAGASLILWTMRSDGRTGTGADNGPVLADAVAFCKARGVEFFGVNENPTRTSWTGSPKVYANVYVDDASIGCPLRESPRAGGRPVADWSAIGPTVLDLVERHFGGG